MKKIILSFALVLISLASYSQKYAFINTEFIYEKIPAYRTAKEQIERIGEEYKKEVDAKFVAIEEMYKQYNIDKVLLSDAMRQKKEEDIIVKEREAKELQRKYFGPDGNIAKRSEELLTPIQNNLMEIVKNYAASEGYAAIIDLANNPSILFYNKRYNVSNDILEKLGYLK